MKKLRQVQMNDGKIYFVDWRLCQLRNVVNPHDYEDFVDDHTMAMHLAVHLEKEVV